METAISGIVVAGITASLLLAVRYSQMVSEGKAVGQQMMTISEGANRYMKQYSQEILRLDARCAESTLQIDEGNNRPSTPPGTGPDCRLVLGSITVANGFQPTVKELQDLELVRANDGLLLPFSPGITVDRRTGEAALARIAVAIRPVRHQQATEGPATGSEATGGIRLPAASFLQASSQASITAWADPSSPSRTSNTKWGRMPTAISLPRSMASAATQERSTSAFRPSS